MITIHELRAKYIDFFKSKGHAEISGKSLIPENDPTVLFTTAGMHPLVPYLLGEPHPAGKRLTDYQKCIRTGDIEEVGDESHLTCFEMLGNWSLGDYFKKESIAYSWEFLTSPEWLALDPRMISVTVFQGDENAPRDETSAEAWKAPRRARRPHRLPRRRATTGGPPVPRAPAAPTPRSSSGSARAFRPRGSNKGSDPKNWMEIWNNVFMEFNRVDEKTLVRLPAQNVDTGMGLERTVCILQGKKSVYDTEAFGPIIEAIEALAGYEYRSDRREAKDRSVRIIADHIRTATFILGDPKAVMPSNVGAGYVLRRIIRRAVRHGRKLGIEGAFLAKPAAAGRRQLLGPLSRARPEPRARPRGARQGRGEIPRDPGEGREGVREDAPEPPQEPAEDHVRPPRLQALRHLRLPHRAHRGAGRRRTGMKVNRPEFDEAYKKHQELSRAGSEQLFKGGLADHSEVSTKYHTATHLLQQALIDRPRRPRRAEGLQHHGRAPALRLRPRRPDDQGGARAGRGHRQRADRAATSRSRWTMMKLDEARASGPGPSSARSTRRRSRSTR